MSDSQGAQNAANNNNDDDSSGDEAGFQPVASPSFIMSGTAGRAGFPADSGIDEANLHKPEDITAVFDDVSPSTPRWVPAIEKFLKDDCSVTEILEPAEIDELCNAAIGALSVEPSLLSIDVVEGSSLAIVGDVHGQFADLVHHILPQKGPKRSFLFLGDYVDRGPQSLEAICLLLALKVTYPRNVFMLRGNHEEAQTSRIYGFFSEAVQKYQNSGTDIWSRVNEVFCHIPVAALVTSANGQRRFFCAHGGLSPDLTDLARVRNIDRVDYGATLDNTSAAIMDGLLWSDPVQEGNSLRFRPNERGCGFVFGPAATQEFCADNNVTLVIRAHQMAMEGYNWSHNQLCLTVFSAPNYCGISNNLGAVAVVDSGLEPTFVQYKSAPSKAHVGPPAPMALPPFFFR